MVETPRRKSIALSQDAEIIFKLMSDEQRRLSLSLNQKLVIPQKSLKKDYLCSLCQAILVEPMKCIQCKSHFHQACLNKFCRETGSCPMQCKKPKFVSIKKDLEKGLNELKFGCPYQDLGCDKVFSYQEAMTHDQNCKYQLVKCQAYSECKTKCIKQDIDNHQSICAYCKVPCIYCLQQVKRIDISQHEKENCTGSHLCSMCSLQVTKDEIQGSSHNCFNSLAGLLGKLVEEKDAVIQLLRDELTRKNKQIMQFIEKQTILELRLQRMEDTLAYEDGSDFSFANRGISLYQEDLLNLRGAYELSMKNDDDGAVIALDQDDNNSTGGSSNQAQTLLDCYENEIPEEVIQKHLSSVSEEFQDTFIFAQSMLSEHKKFLKSPDWELHSTVDNCQLYIRLSERKINCLKSKATIDLPIQSVFSMIQDLELKPKYDETFQQGHYLQNFPLETAIIYYQYRKMLLVNPRDMIMLVKIHRVSPDEIYILAKTIDSQHPEQDGVVRADCYAGGWKIKSLNPKQTKVVFYSETDYKINQFISKQVISKSGHLAHALKKYVNQQQKKGQKFY